MVGRARALGLFGAALLALSACDGDGGGAGGTGGGGAGGSGGTGTGTSVAQATKVDILFAIDNSRSMADKQQILSLALDDLLTGLAAPPCLDPNGQLISQPGPQEPCPEGSARQYEPITDIHIGVISSSLGGHGSDACDASGAGEASNDDKAHLLDRLDPAAGGTVPTYQGAGFLAWDPAQQMSPPGESDPAALGEAFKDLVIGVGQIGCGYESQLESVYRFLVDPTPHASITVDQGLIVKQGVDADLLEQRKRFLRPDSLLIVLSLSDENDCSIREEQQFYMAAQQKAPNNGPFHLPAPRAVCATDPNDECCFSCGQTGPVDGNGDPTCPADPTCQDGGGVKFLDETSDSINLRCFDQKRRFGIDFLYPIDRYVSGFTSPTVADKDGQIVPNPLFSDLDPTDGNSNVRSPDLVVFAGVVGVPWQAIAKNSMDLKQGFKNVTELSQPDAGGHTTWDYILGGSGAAPLDPRMIESIGPRGTAIDRAIPQNDDLQYACVMPIPMARDCTAPSEAACDCFPGQSDNPLCEADPATGEHTFQTKAKAYPGVRQLAFMKDLGAQAVVTSICAGQIDDPSLPDYAYRPVVSSLLDSVKDRLQ